MAALLRHVGRTCGKLYCRTGPANPPRAGPCGPPRSPPRRGGPKTSCSVAVGNLPGLLSLWEDAPQPPGCGLRPRRVGDLPWSSFRARLGWPSWPPVCCRRDPPRPLPAAFGRGGSPGSNCRNSLVRCPWRPSQALACCGEDALRSRHVAGGCWGGWLVDLNCPNSLVRCLWRSSGFSWRERQGALGGAAALPFSSRAGVVRGAWP